MKHLYLKKICYSAGSLQKAVGLIHSAIVLQSLRLLFSSKTFCINRVKKTTGYYNRTFNIVLVCLDAFFFPFFFFSTKETVTTGSKWLHDVFHFLFAQAFSISCYAHYSCRSKPLKAHYALLSFSC